MSEYQYYEFCRINEPISQEARKEMRSLSSRANVSTHGASYVYNYGNFRGKPKELLLKHFDVFFYISNFGTIQLMFKYKDYQIEIEELKKYNISDVISCKQYGDQILLDICVHNEKGFGWIEGEGWLADFLPIYDEIKAKDYRFLHLIKALHNKFTGENQDPLNKTITEGLSAAHEAFLESIDLKTEAALL